MKRVLLSGASSGIGKVAAEYLSHKGYEVVSIGRTAVEGIENICVDFSLVPDAGQLQAAFSKQAPFDAFINCAGLLPGKDFRNYTPELQTELFNINVFTPVALIDYLTANDCLNGKAAIILFSSISAYKGSFDDFYAASKGAINALIKSLALKLAPAYRVVGIAPGMTERTRMTDELVEGRFEHNLKLIPAGQAVQPEEIVHLLEYVIEHGSSMVGNVIDINGGQYLR